MQMIRTFNELLTNAQNLDFCGQQNLLRLTEQPTSSIKLLVKNLTDFIELAAVNDMLAAKLAQSAAIRNLITHFNDLQKLAELAPETTTTLLNYIEVRKVIKNFKQLCLLLESIELLKITLPPRQDIRALIKNPAQLSQLNQLHISAHSNSNLAQLFTSYADVRKRFKSFKQLLQFIKDNPATSQFFIKDPHTIQLVKNAKQLNNLLTEINQFNPRWAKNLAMEFFHSEKIANLFKEATHLLNYLSYLPDQASIRKLLNEQAHLAQLLKLEQQPSLLEMDFFKAKQLYLEEPKVPCNLLQYA